MPPDLYAGGGGAWATGQLTQHGDPDGDAGAVLNVPIAEGTAAFRGLVYGGIDGGYIDDRRRDENDINRVRTLGARGAIRVSVAADRATELTGPVQSLKGADGQSTTRTGRRPSRTSAGAAHVR